MATLFDEPTLESGARFSDDGLYRYELWRKWSDEPLLCWIMLNPSTAGAVENDATIERCCRRAQRWGYGGIVVANLFAFRATDPAEMLRATDPVGPENDAAILAAAGQSRKVIAGWGNDGGHRGRSQAVRALLRDARIPLHCLKITKAGEPFHPLYVAYAVEPTLWEE